MTVLPFLPYISNILVLSRHHRELCRIQDSECIEISARWEYLAMGKKVGKTISVMQLVIFTIHKAICQALSQIIVHLYWILLL